MKSTSETNMDFAFVVGIMVGAVWVVHAVRGLVLPGDDYEYDIYEEPDLHEEYEDLYEDFEFEGDDLIHQDIKI